MKKKTTVHSIRTVVSRNVIGIIVFIDSGL